MDLRGLAALFGKINALLADDSRNEEVESLDLFGLSRFLQRRGDAQRAHSTCAQAIELGLPFEVDRQARCELALMAKRRGDHHDAAALWQELAKDEQTGVHACEQLAIYYERRRKDLGRALEFAQLALAKARRLQSFAAGPRGRNGGGRRGENLVIRVARLKPRTAGEMRGLPTLAFRPARQLARTARYAGLQAA